MRPYTNSRCSVIQLSNPVLQKHPPPNLSHHFTPGFVHVLKLVYNRSKTQTYTDKHTPHWKYQGEGAAAQAANRALCRDVLQWMSLLSDCWASPGTEEGETPCSPTGASLELQSPAHLCVKSGQTSPSEASQDLVCEGQGYLCYSSLNLSPPLVSIQFWN